MKLDRLRIPDYRNLRSFEIDFDESTPTTVLLGRNGSGKSNLIEAIVEIFRDLELGEDPPFAYQLEYVCRERAIRIDADPARKGRRFDITVDGVPLTLAAFRRALNEYLPSYVFAYYSGWSSRLERHFDRPTRKYYEQILRNPDREMPLRRLFFCRKDYSQLVLLGFVLAEQSGARELLQQYFNISRLDSALFVLKTPWWRGSGAPSEIQVAEGDPRFWYARGAFKGFLDRLWRRALAPIRNTETVERDVRRQGERTERLYVFIKNEGELAALKEQGEDTKTLFGYLEALFLCDLIDEVRITVERTDGTRVKFTQMSEGEQQLLTVLGLLLFTQNDEALYLLDEPDTHLNPVWTYEFLRLLQDNIHAEKGQLVVATHNPLMIGSLHKNEVRVVEAVRGLNGQLHAEAKEPDEDPFAMGVDGLLMSELYGLPSVLPEEVTSKIHERNELYALNQRNPAQEVRLRELSDELAELGVLRSYVDPYERAFVNAMTRRSDRLRSTLSAEDVKARNERADEILEEIIVKETGGK